MGQIPLDDAVEAIEELGDDANTTNLAEAVGASRDATERKVALFAAHGEGDITAEWVGRTRVWRTAASNGSGSDDSE